MREMEFAGKAVIVTGAAQGIGRTIAEQFLKQGAKVLIFDLDAELVEVDRQGVAGGKGVQVVIVGGGDGPSGPGE